VRRPTEIVDDDPLEADLEAEQQVADQVSRVSGRSFFTPLIVIEIALRRWDPRR